SFISVQSFAQSFSCSITPTNEPTSLQPLSRRPVVTALRAVWAMRCAAQCVTGHRPVATTAFLKRFYEAEPGAPSTQACLRGKSRSESGDGLLFQSISIFSIFGPLSFSHLLI